MKPVTFINAFPAALSLALLALTTLDPTKEPSAGYAAVFALPQPAAQAARLPQAAAYPAAHFPGRAPAAVRQQR